MEQINKDIIKKEVTEIVNKFCDEHFKSFEFQVEGSLTENYRYLSRENVSKALELCFNETIRLMNENCKS